MLRRLSSASVMLLLLPSAAFAWDYDGHRAINQLALKGLPGDFPDFVLTAEARERIAFLAGEPDRWRNVPELPFKHVSGPDHYIDVEDLSWTDSTLSTVPEFRFVYAGQLGVAQEKHPERFPAVDPAKNLDRTRELPGFLPWAVAENFGKLKSAFTYLKTYEACGGTAEEIANAKANAIYVMGVMGHYVGDGAQPLHTTRHYNGWVGPNPGGYTTDKTFHALIDEVFFALTGGLSLDELAPRARGAQVIVRTADDPRSAVFSAVTRYVAEQHAKVEPLYRLEKEGKLTPGAPAAEEGRRFLEEQLLTGAQMLSSLWYTAWREADVDTYLKSVLEKRTQKQP